MAKELVKSVISVRIAVLEKDRLEISAQGEVGSAGWSEGEFRPYAYIRPPDDGIYDFSFVATPPSDPALPVMRPLVVTQIIDAVPDTLRGVRIHGANNSMEALLDDRVVELPTEQSGPPA